MTAALTDPAQILAEARQALASGQIEKSAGQLEYLVAEFPGDPRTWLLKGDILEARARYGEAAELYGGLSKRWPQNAAIVARLVGALAASGNIAAAIALYRAQVADGEFPEADKTGIARRLAAANRRNPEAAAILEARAVAAPDDAGLLREAGSSMMATGRLNEAVEFFSRSATLSPLPGWAAVQYLDALTQRRRYDGAIPVADAQILAVLRDALFRFPRDGLFVRHFSRLAVPLAQWTALYRTIRDGIETQGAEGLLLFEVAKLCLQAGDVEDARRMLGSLDPATHWGKVSRPLREALDAIPPATWKRGRLVDDPAAELQVVRKSGAGTTIILFATLTGNFMMLPLATVDALLADLDANIVYVRDTVFGSCVNGLRSLGSDFRPTLAHLNELIADLGARELVTVGASVSGLSAIRFGARLGAGRVVTFGALTTVDPEFAGTPAGLQRTMRRFKERTATDGAVRFGDLIAELSVAPEMNVDLYVGASCTLDRQQADRLIDIPQIAVHQVPDVDHHYVALTLIVRDRFTRAIAGTNGELPNADR